MQKIMFNDQYGLTQAVLDGRKTMTRRAVSACINKKACLYRQEYFDNTLDALSVEDSLLEFSSFKPGEVVAVAQSYMDAGNDPHMLQFIYIKEPTILPFSDGLPVLGYVEAPIMYHAGWKNKMFVHPTMMPHQIRITNIKVERLKDISDEDCMKEGIVKVPQGFYSFEGWGGKTTQWYAMTPRDAFAVLINKVSGNGTWGSNPYVYAYEFELVK